MINLDEKNLGGWAIEKCLIEDLCEMFPNGGTILEFGSGRGTIELTKYFKVISVEHDPKWIGIASSSTYVHAPIVGNWYDMGPVMDAIKGKNIDVILLDGPPGSIGRKGFLQVIKDLPIPVAYIIDDTHREEEELISAKVCFMTGRLLLRNYGNNKSYDIIQ